MENDPFLRPFNQLPARQRSAFRLLKPIAVGGQAIVYQGVGPGPEGRHVPVALKIFKTSDQEVDPETLKDEGRRLQAMSESEHIIDVHWLDSFPIQYGSGRAKRMVRYPYIVMELADGGSVKDELEAGRLTTERTLTLAVQAMEGLKYAHAEDRPDATDAERVVHRDIKPANLLLVGDRVKVADFGIAVNGHESDATITRTQLAAGTGPYMAPEQIYGRAVIASDIYSMAVTTYQMLTGRLPLQREDGRYWGEIHLHDIPQQTIVRHPAGGVDHVAMAMQDPILQALAKRPTERFPSMGAFQAAIIEAAERGRVAQAQQRSYIDLGAIPSAPVEPGAVTQTGYESYTLQMLLPKTKAVTPFSAPEAAGKAAALTRRKLLGIVGGMATLAVGVGAERIIAGGHEAPKDSAETEKAAAVTTAREVIKLCQEHNLQDDMYSIIRYMIPLDHQAAYAEMQKMPIDKIVWLAADLAFFDPAAAETVMQHFEGIKDYANATVIATALAFYSKEKPDSKDIFISGRPVDPVLLAAANAAERVRQACVDAKQTDLQAVIEVGQATSYVQKESPFSTKLINIAQTNLDAFRKDGRDDLVRLICHVIVRDNAPIVKDTINSYEQQQKAAKSDSETAMIQDIIRDLAIDLVPYDTTAAAATATRLAKQTSSVAQAAADAVVTALVPYDGQFVANYVSDANFGHPTRYAIGVGLAQSNPTFAASLYKEADDTVKAWVDVAAKPRNSALTHTALEVLKGNRLQDYAYWVAAGLLLSQTDAQ